MKVNGETQLLLHTKAELIDHNNSDEFLNK